MTVRRSGEASGFGLPLAVSAVAALAARPDLWATTLGQVRTLAPKAWWRRPPFLPLPDRDYLAFRLQTMYGSDTATASADDVVTYLEWCKSFDTIV